MRFSKRFSFLVISSLFSSSLVAQDIFSHNDYHAARPFYGAFEAGATYIESDIFLKDDQLLVGHTQSELIATKTIQAMYLEPLRQLAKEGKLDRKIVLMVDIKTKATPTLDALTKVLYQFPELTTQSLLQITISGNYPSPSEWSNYPPFIHFDGRPGIDYTKDQLNRVTLISSSFKDWSSWKGKGKLPPQDERKLTQVIDKVHGKGKPVRFWASPDVQTAWQKWLELKIDIINTDHPADVAVFLSGR